VLLRISSPSCIIIMFCQRTLFLALWLFGLSSGRRISSVRRHGQSLHAAVEERLQEDSLVVGIADAAITASSFQLKKRGLFAPAAARMESRSAWCPQKKKDQWLQFDFGHQVEINSLTLEGSSTKNWWVEEYYLTYSNHGHVWIPYDIDRTFAGLDNDAESVSQKLNPPIVAQMVRIHPRSWRKRPCLRIDFFGRKAPEDVYYEEEDELDEGEDTESDADDVVISPRPEDAVCGSSLVGTTGNHVLNDDAITASSYVTRRDRGCGTNSSRLNSNSAWCAYHKDDPFIQYDFGRMMKLRKILTKGRADRKRLFQWVTKFTLQYSQGECWKDHPQLFEGNVNSNSLKTNMIEPPIMAQWVRIRPLEWHRNPSLRADFHGCQADEEVEGDVCPPEPETIPEYENTYAYNEAEAKQFLQYGRVSFCSQQAVESWSCGEMCDHARIVPGQVRYLEDKAMSVAGYVAVLPDDVRSGDPKAGPKCMVSFRGTVDVANWKSNFNFPRMTWPPSGPLHDGRNETWCPNCFAHRGFAMSYEALRWQYLDAVNNLGCRSLIFTGHSLGGAIAIFASFEARVLLDVDVDVVYTYGAPRVGNKALVRAYMDAARKAGKPGPPLWRIVRYHDPVPRVPPAMVGFAHMPQEVYYKRPMDEYRICNSTRKNLEDTGCAYHTPIGLCINGDHITYFNSSLRTKLFPPECDAAR